MASNKVYLVNQYWEESREPNNIIGIFSSLKKAEEAVLQLAEKTYNNLLIQIHQYGYYCLDQECQNYYICECSLDSGGSGLDLMQRHYTITLPPPTQRML